MAAILLFTMVTLITGLAAVHHAAHTHVVAHLITGDLWADLDHPANDFVAGHQRVMLVAPVAVHRMQIGMANAAEQNFDGHIIAAQGSPLKMIGLHVGIGGKSRVTDGFHRLSREWISLETLTTAQ